MTLYSTGPDTVQGESMERSQMQMNGFLKNKYNLNEANTSP